MRTFLAGILVGVVSAVLAVACGVPDHFHNTNDIKTIGTDGGGSGACKCKEPTNTIRVVEREIDCSRQVDIAGGAKGVVFSGVEYADIITAAGYRKSQDGLVFAGESIVIQKGPDGTIAYRCGSPSAKTTLRLLLRR